MQMALNQLLSLPAQQNTATAAPSQALDLPPPPEQVEDGALCLHDMLQRHPAGNDRIAALGTSMNNILSNLVPYETIQGPNEFTFTGNLKDWDRTERLGEIDVPTLITVCRYDELTPECAETMHRGIPNSQLRVFERSAHMSHVEESDEYIDLLRSFLNKVDA